MRKRKPSLQVTLCLLISSLPLSGATLVAHWQLDGDTTTVVGTNNASISGAPSWVGGKISQALEFDGAAPPWIMVKPLPHRTSR